MRLENWLKPGRRRSLQGAELGGPAGRIGSANCSRCVSVDAVAMRRVRVCLALAASVVLLHVLADAGSVVAVARAETKTPPRFGAASSASRNRCS